MNELEPKFPLEFIVEGTPVSSQCDTATTKEKWKERVKQASNAALPEGHYATERKLAMTIYYFPPEEMQGDVDNIVKLIADALKRHVYMDDRQLERVTVQKFEPGTTFSFRDPSAILTDTLTRERPVLFIRLSADVYEDLR